MSKFVIEFIMVGSVYGAECEDGWSYMEASCHTPYTSAKGAACDDFFNKGSHDGSRSKPVDAASYFSHGYTAAMNVALGPTRAPHYNLGVSHWTTDRAEFVDAADDGACGRLVEVKCAKVPQNTDMSENNCVGHKPQNLMMVDKQVDRSNWNLQKRGLDVDARLFGKWAELYNQNTGERKSAECNGLLKLCVRQGVGVPPQTNSTTNTTSG